MALYNHGIAGEILPGDDVRKIQSYLYQLNEQLRYMFANLTPEDNYAPEALEKYLEDGDKRTLFEVTLDEIKAEMITGDNVVSAINLSREGVKILGERISLEGVVTVNDFFRVGLDGSIEARNGKFSGHISASTMDSSEIALGGNGMDGKITVKDNSDQVIGEWTKTGIDVKKGVMSGTAITLGGSGNTGKISLLNGSGVEIGTWDKNGQVMKDANGTTIGTWNAGGIDVKKGAISGTAITVGGSGNTGKISVLNSAGTEIGLWDYQGLTMKDASGNVIGSWKPTGINVKKGSISGTGITVGGSGSPGWIEVQDGQGNVIGEWNFLGIDVMKGTISGTAITLGGSGTPGSVTVLDSTGTTTLGTWTSSGIDVRRGSIQGTAITLGGTGTPGSMTIYDTTGTSVIGSWGSSGITVNKGTLDIRTSRDFHFHAGSDYIRIGDFEVNDYYNRQILQSYDEVTGMSAEPGGSGRLYLWAGWNGSVNTCAFYVDNTQDHGYGNTVIHGGLFLNGTDIGAEISRIWAAIEDLDPEPEGGGEGDVTIEEPSA